jgi:leucyl aminopeptidase
MVAGSILKGKIEEAKAPLLVVFTHEDGDSTEFKRIDKILKGQLSELKKNKEFEGKAMTLSLLRTPSSPFKRVLVVGLGKKKDLSLETLRRGAGIAAKAAREQVQEIAIPVLHDKVGLRQLDAVAQAITEGVILGDYRFLKYKTQDVESLKQLASFTLLVEEKTQVKAAAKGLGKGTILSASVNYARDLVNTPAADMSPAALEEEAKKLAKRHGLKLTVFDAAELKRRGMNAILSVGKGSAIPPRMIILEYRRPGAKRHLVLCGKGVCYDSGGYNLKTSMLELMKDDMGGAAALLGTLDAFATLKAKAHVTVIIGAVENLISGSAYKAGDVVKASNGKTIEVLNTDAEGRVVLADCLSYASAIKDAHMILDIATLTGAAKVALGTVGGVLTPNDRLAKTLIEVGEETGDRAWRLPLWEDHKEDIKSDIADMKNTGYPMTAGASAGAVFLQEFVAQPEQWAHIDIGGAVYDDRERPYLPKGATGWGVRLLTRFVEQQ